MPLAAAALLLACGCGRDAGKAAPPPAPPPPALDFTARDAADALALAGEFTRDCSPRDAGTPGAAKAAEWIRARLGALGFGAVESDAFADASPKGSVSFHNIYAALPGSGPGWVVLLTHFDTKPGIPGFVGANDGASSTALMLALARKFKGAGAQFRNSLMFAFLDGEESMVAYGENDGFQGSRRLARRLRRENRDVRAVILMDMIGDRGLKITMPRNCSARLRVLGLEAADAVGERAKIGLHDGDIYDDHQAFLDAGFDAVDLIDFDYGSAPGLNDYWHTPEDTLDKLSAESLRSTARIAIEMARRLE